MKFCLSNPKICSQIPQLLVSWMLPWSQVMLTSAFLNPLKKAKEQVCTLQNFSVNLLVNQPTAFHIIIRHFSCIKFQLIWDPEWMRGVEAVGAGLLQGCGYEDSIPYRFKKKLTPGHTVRPSICLSSCIFNNILWALFSFSNTLTVTMITHVGN